MELAIVLTIIQTTMAAVTLIILLTSSYKITKIEHSTNSMKDELVSEVRLAAFAAGVKKQKESYEQN